MGRLSWRPLSFLFLDSHLNRPLHGSPNNQSPSAAQPSPTAPSNHPKSVTQNSASTTPPTTPPSSKGGLLRRPRRHHHRSTGGSQSRIQDLPQRHVGIQHRHRHEQCRHRHHRLRCHRYLWKHRLFNENCHHRRKLNPAHFPTNGRDHKRGNFNNTIASVARN